MTAVLRSDEMPLVLRQITAVFADPAFRTEAWPYAESVLRGMTSPLWNQPEGAVQQLILPLLAGGDFRLGIPGDHVLYSRTREELRSWLGSQVASGPMELAVIGDVDVDDAIAEISKTFGALPVRESYRLNQERTKLNFPLRPVSTYAYYEGTEDRPSTLEFFWPVRDQIDNTQRRHLLLLADILENRITEQFREQNSITFSPRASLMWNSTYPGFSFIRCTVEVAPSNATDTGDAIRELAAQMSQGGVKPDELLRAKAQRHANARAARTDNEAWLVNVLSDVQQRPHRLDEARTLETDIDSATVGDVNSLARRYLGTDKPFRYIIDPNSRMQKQ
jgi:zinc protease